MQSRVTKTYKLYEDNGIVHLIVHEGSVLHYEEVKDIDVYIKNNLTSKKHLKLFDARGSFTMESQAKNFFESPKLKSKMLAQAILIGSNTRQQIIDLFGEMNSTKLPVKLFVDYDEAIGWLGSFIKKTE